MNTQPIEKAIKTENGLLSLHSIFRTIQGEGPFCGTPAVFVRLAGCNLQCPKCDTDYTSGRTEVSAATILDRVSELQQGGLVVITGGEPFRQHLRPLFNILVGAGYYVQVETNGTLPPAEFLYNVHPETRTGVYVVCSPKTGTVHKYIFDVACCLKYVVSHESVSVGTGLPLRVLEHSAHPWVSRPPINWTRPVYVQPADAKDDKENELNLKAAIDSCMKNGYILQLQIHKLIGME